MVAVGTSTLNYQWTKNGTNAPGQTSATLTFGNVSTNDAGNYAVVVTNTYGAVTSSIWTPTCWILASATCRCGRRV